MKNPILTGQLIAVYNKQMAIDSIKNRCGVIYVGDMTGMSNYEMSMYINGAPLIPDVKAMQSLIMGEKDKFCYLYDKQLHEDPVVIEYIETIICALFKGKTIILYIPEDALEFGYHEILFQFFKNIIGLNIQTGPNNLFYFDSAYIVQVLVILMKYQMIDQWYYLYMIPVQLMNDKSFIINFILPYMGYENNEDNIKLVINIKNKMEMNNKVMRPMISFDNSME